LKKREKPDTFKTRKRFTESGVSGKAALILATWFGTGLLPFAPGTFGTLGAVPLVLALQHYLLACRIPFFLLFLATAIWASGRAASLLDTPDPSQVVIDEVTGFLAATVLLRFSWQGLGAAFILFRVFDILKPFPVGFLDRKVKGGVGIVLDDVAAGCYALGVMEIMQYLRLSG
jgi:phosphatidylglycerophosphatase A